MNPNHLRFFLATVEEGSVTAAARRCFVTQPTLSAGLAALEREMGGKLLERSKRGVSLTPLGESILEPSREIVHRVSHLRSVARQKQERYMRLAVSRSVPVQHVRQLLDACRNHGEVTEVRVLECDVDSAASLLSEGRADALLSTDLGEPMLQRNRLLLRESYGVSMHREHALASKRPLKVSDLDGQDIIVRMHSEETWVATQALREANSNPVVLARVSSDAMALALLAAGQGVCVLPRSVYHNSREKSDLVWHESAAPDHHRHVRLLWQDSIWDEVFEAVLD